MDKDSKLPLYMQFKSEMLERIRSGEFKTGSMVPTEQALCRKYGISRYPVRQAMDELVAEGYLHRTRGRGTFISDALPGGIRNVNHKMIGIILANLSGGFCGQILSGFEKQARRKGYMMAVCCSEGNPQEECACIDQLLDNGAAGIFVLPCDESQIIEKYAKLKEKKIYLGLLDRNPGIEDVDYVGSDNVGGAYSAVRHLALQGYRNVVFVSDKSRASSVEERLEGYLKAVEDFGLRSVSPIDINEDLGKYPFPMYRFFLDKLKDELVELKKHTPIGVFAINDSVALQCMRIFQEEGMAVGQGIGLIGFDNEKECEIAPVPLTSVAQNGLLIGQTAADIAIDKLLGYGMVFKSIVPTQLVVRNSCGEKASGKFIKQE